MKIVQIKKLLNDIFFLKRSLSGKDNFKTLKIIQREIPINIKSFNTGKTVYDWKIPKVWTLKNAFIKDASGKKIIDIKENFLHVASHSIKVNKKLTWKKLKKNIFSSKSKLGIPYRTCYYDDKWAFCVSKKQYQLLKKEKEKLHVFIDSTKKKGKMHYGELLIKGKSKKEIILSTYICHPNLANDNLSGILSLTGIAKYLLKQKRNFSYRVIFIPETIGAVAYLKKNQKQIMNKTHMAMVVCNCGGYGKFSYKKSFEESHEINFLIKQNFKKNKLTFTEYPFEPFGSDERQFSSYPFRINCASIFKDKYYEFKEYHTSLDNLEFVRPKNIQSSIKLHESLIDIFEKLNIYIKTHFAETMLSKYKLYSISGGAFKPTNKKIKKILKILFYCDGKKSTLAISKLTSVSHNDVKKLLNQFENKKIVKKII